MPSATRPSSRSCAAAALLALLAAGAASTVSADCLAPAPGVLWTYPADGDVDVPLDTALWLASNVASFGRVPRVELNDAALDAFGEASNGLAPLQFQLPRLAPNTSYVWKLSYPPTNEQSARTFQVRFTTGSNLREAAPKVRVVGHSEHDVTAGAHPCAAIVASQRCLDAIGERPPRRHELVVTPASAVGWVVRSRAGEQILWPGVCGAPQIVVDESQAKECFVVQAIGAGGQLGTPRAYCTSEKLAPLRKTDAVPPPVGLSPLAPLPPPAEPELPATAPPTPSAPPPRAEPTSAPTAGSSSGCSVAAVDDPLHPGFAFLLAGLWRRRRAKREPLLAPSRMMVIAAVASAQRDVERRAAE
jgi:hypothetical protein